MKFLDDMVPDKWVAVSQADADQIRQDAELTGTDILSRSDERDFDTGYWGPILDSASFNGIANNPY